MKKTWKTRLIEASRKLNDDDAPTWWDGFHNVIARNELYCEKNNPYRNNKTWQKEHDGYKAGAIAAEWLLYYLGEVRRV